MYSFRWYTLDGFCGGKFLNKLRQDTVKDVSDSYKQAIKELMATSGIKVLSSAQIDILRHTCPSVYSEMVNSGEFVWLSRATAVYISNEYSAESMKDDPMIKREGPSTTFGVMQMFKDEASESLLRSLDDFTVDRSRLSNVSDLGRADPYLQVASAQSVCRKGAYKMDVPATHLMFSKDLSYMGPRYNPEGEFEEDSVDMRDFSTYSLDTMTIHASFTIMYMLYSRSRPLNSTLEGFAAERATGRKDHAVRAISADDLRSIYNMHPHDTRTFFITDCPVFRNYNYSRGSLCMGFVAPT